jgi:ketosteroid isomerase-like protein
MSQDNIEVVQAIFDLFNRDGIEAALGYFDPEIEWLGPPEWLEEHLYKGHDGMRKIAAVWGENFDEYRLDLERLIDIGDELVVLVYQRGRIKGSGDVIEQPIGYEWYIREGRTVRVQVHFSWEAALEAAGLSE